MRRTEGQKDRSLWKAIRVLTPDRRTEKDRKTEGQVIGESYKGFDAGQKDRKTETERRKNRGLLWKDIRVLTPDTRTEGQRDGETEGHYGNICNWRR